METAMTSMLSATLSQITLKSFWGQEPVAYKKASQIAIDERREATLVDVLKEAGVPMTRVQMCEACGVSKATHDRTIRRLMDQGLVEVVDPRVYNRTWGLK
jgi:transcription initiation factor IIE alpha subunit